MSGWVLDIEYVDVDPATAWPLRPWTASAPAEQAETGSEAVPATAGAVPGASPRKARDRGASAVEWVVITAIVVAIVSGVGYAISQALDKKAKSTTSCIDSTDGTAKGCGTGTAP